MKQIVLCDGGDTFETSKICKKYNLGVNIDNFYKPDYLLNNPNTIKEHLEMYKNIDICSIHGPFCDLNYGSNDTLIVEATLKRFEYAYEISCKLSCQNIVLHNGYVPGTSFPTNWIKRGEIFWKKFLENKDDGVIFYIENLLEHDPGMIIDIINNVNRKNLKMCIDIGHVNVFSDINVLEWIKNASENIGFVHLHNNNGKKDEHNGITNGNMDINKICETLEQYCPDAIWAIETKEYEASIKWLIENKYIQ